mmetsp:Transcript_92359/g.197910  ORF Transcript_92359/g.197910 Transcript_92359/m.197910 type:complete len:554 (+) Transcript_92359:93-1754(+)
MGAAAVCGKGLTLRAAAALLLLAARLGEGFTAGGADIRVPVNKFTFRFYQYEAPENCTPIVPYSSPLEVLAGTLGFFGHRGDGGHGMLAQMRMPRSLALDLPGQGLYVADAGNHVVRLINLTTGIISTAVGVLRSAGYSGDGGQATAAQLREPHGLIWDGEAQRLYLADRGNHVVRCVDRASGLISRVAGTPGTAGDSGDGGPANAALLNSPSGLALDAEEQQLYVSDTGNNGVRVVNLTGGTLEGLTIQGALNQPLGLALDLPNQLLYVADCGSHTVRMVDINATAENGTGAMEVVLGKPGQVGGRGDAATVFRGDEGPAEDARLRCPTDLALDWPGQRLFVADSATPSIRVVDLPSQVVTMAVGRPGYYDHELTDDDAGPVGLALEESVLPGFRIEHIIHNDPDGRQVYGKYFYFNSSHEVFNFTGGVFFCRLYRRRVLLWLGLVQFFPHKQAIGPDGLQCPQCNAQGIRYPLVTANTDFWELGDIIHVGDLMEAPRQKIYMAEGANFIVRVTDVATPQAPICHTWNVTREPDWTTAWWPTTTPPPPPPPR